MKARLLVNLSLLTLTALAGTAAHAADEEISKPAWQNPDYVMEVVVVTAPRPSALAPTGPTEETTLAWQEPGYVQEVVVVKASRSRLLAAAGWSGPLTPRLHLALVEYPKN